MNKLRYSSLEFVAMAAVRHNLASPPAPITSHRSRAPASYARAQIRHHLQSFLAGGVAALSFGYYRLHQDVWQAASAVDSRLDLLGRETVTSQVALQARVDSLEAQVTKLKEALASKAGA
jgi:BMFP domain-containing protein YqiC